MFGVAVYCRDRVVALICGDPLFVKPTPGERAFIGDVVEAPVIQPKRTQRIDMLPISIPECVNATPSPSSRIAAA